MAPRCSSCPRSPVWYSRSRQPCSTATNPRSPRPCDMDAVLLENVGKGFEKVVLRSGYTTLKTALTHLFSGGAPPPERVEALSGVNLVVPAGATIGLLG